MLYSLVLILDDYYPPCQPQHLPHNSSNKNYDLCSYPLSHRVSYSTSNQGSHKESHNFTNTNSFSCSSPHSYKLSKFTFICYTNSFDFLYIFHTDTMSDVPFTVLDVTPCSHLLSTMVLLFVDCIVVDWWCVEYDYPISIRSHVQWFWFAYFDGVWPTSSDGPVWYFWWCSWLDWCLSFDYYYFFFLFLPPDVMLMCVCVCV